LVLALVEVSGIQVHYLILYSQFDFFRAQVQIAKPPSRSTELREKACSGGVWNHSNYCLGVQTRREQEAFEKRRILDSQCSLNLVKSKKVRGAFGE